MAKIEAEKVTVEVTSMETKSEIPQHKLRNGDTQFNSTVKAVEIKHGIMVAGKPHYRGEKLELDADLAKELEAIGKVKILK